MTDSEIIWVRTRNRTQVVVIGNPSLGVFIGFIKVYADGWGKTFNSENLGHYDFGFLRANFPFLNNDWESAETIRHRNDKKMIINYKDLYFEFENIWIEKRFKFLWLLTGELENVFVLEFVCGSFC